MSNEHILCDTPRYVLLEGKDPIGPDVTSTTSNAGCVAIYGFSAKRAYDAFISNSDRQLRPYPLMKGYLRNRIADGQGETFLVVIDPVTSTDEHVNVATMQSILAAHNGNEKRINSGLQDMCKQQNNNYQWNELIS